MYTRTRETYFDGLGAVGKVVFVIRTVVATAVAKLRASHTPHALLAREIISIIQLHLASRFTFNFDAAEGVHADPTCYEIVASVLAG